MKLVHECLLALAMVIVLQVVTDVLSLDMQNVLLGAFCYVWAHMLINND